jgi:hypothetical protein
VLLELPEVPVLPEVEVCADTPESAAKEMTAITLNSFELIFIPLFVFSCDSEMRLSPGTLSPSKYSTGRNELRVNIFPPLAPYFRFA